MGARMESMIAAIINMRPSCPSSRLSSTSSSAKKTPAAEKSGQKRHKTDQDNNDSRKQNIPIADVREFVRNHSFEFRLVKFFNDARRETNHRVLRIASGRKSVRRRILDNIYFRHRKSGRDAKIFDDIIYFPSILARAETNLAECSAKAVWRFEAAASGAGAGMAFRTFKIPFPGRTSTWTAFRSSVVTVSNSRRSNSVVTGFLASREVSQPEGRSEQNTIWSPATQ